jgi:hypothetical protein
MKRRYCYWVAGLLALTCSPGCSCAYSTSASTGTSTTSVNHKNEGHRHVRAASKDKKQEKKSTEDKSASASIDLAGKRRASGTKLVDHAAAGVTTQTEASQPNDSTQADKSTVTNASRKPGGSDKGETVKTQGASSAVAQTSKPTLSGEASTSTDTQSKSSGSSASSGSTASDGTSMAAAARRARAKAASSSAKSRARSSETENAQAAVAAHSRTAVSSETTADSSAKSGRTIKAPSTVDQEASLKEQPSRGSILLKAPSKSTVSCSLVGKEAPRGGKIEIKAAGFGSTPVIRLAGKVLRVLRQEAALISVQVPEDADSGSITLSASGTTADCGALQIIGKNR